MAEKVIRNIIPKMSADDVAGVLVDIGMGECAEWDDFLDQWQFKLSDMQTVAAAAALASALDGLEEDALGGEIEVEFVEV